MGRALIWITVAVAVSGPTHAQNAQSHLSEADKTQLSAFGKAFVIVRQSYIDPLSAKTLILRAVHGLATAPTLASQEQKRVIAAAADRVNTMAADDVLPLLRGFGDLLEALRATAGGPGMDGMVRAATAGMLDGLDSRTRLIPPTQTASPAAEAGVGLKLTVSLDGVLVVRAFPHNPAAEAGVRQGDDVVSIDGHVTKDLPLQQVMTLLRGPVGSSAVLLIRRGEALTPITVDVSRAVLRLPLVSGRIVGSIAYLRLESFVPGAAQALRREYADLQSHAASPLGGIVLDLRDNPGGRLDEAVKTAAELLAPATLIATATARDPSGDQRFTATGGDITGGLPMVVLVNEATGAGSEVVAAALQKGRGAVLMGSHTAGAGLVGTVISLPPLGAMELTTQRLVLASGQSLKPPGVLPQIALFPRAADRSGPASAEASSSDPMIVRLRRGIPQAPEAGEPFFAPDSPEQDFQVRQAFAALAMLATR
jgi:carboxyl-terminal processing protease